MSTTKFEDMEILTKKLWIVLKLYVISYDFSLPLVAYDVKFEKYTQLPLYCIVFFGQICAFCTLIMVISRLEKRRKSKFIFGCGVHIFE